MAENDSFTPTIEAAENGFMVKPPWGSKLKPVVVNTIDEAIYECGEMAKEAWDEKHRQFSKMRENGKDAIEA